LAIDKRRIRRQLLVDLLVIVQELIHPDQLPVSQVRIRVLIAILIAICKGSIAVLISIRVVICRILLVRYISIAVGVPISVRLIQVSIRAFKLRLSVHKEAWILGELIPDLRMLLQE